MEIVEVTDRYRITVTAPIRDVVLLKVGQKVAVIPFGDKILVKPLPDNPEEEPSKLIDDIVFDRHAREKASELGFDG
jgi:bifunctional DNA-binding transcriptional regulator/antitoxin component of YhaV-PrlF toxin-antitoxin module